MRTINRLQYKKQYNYYMPCLLYTSELEKQRRTKFEYQPKISIVVPLYKTPEKYLRQLVDTVKAQTYPNWELCPVSYTHLDVYQRQVQGR